MRAHSGQIACAPPNAMNARHVQVRAHSPTHRSDLPTDWVSISLMSKPPDQRKRPQIGDLIEIETPRGYAYAQYIYKHREPPRMGSLIRVLPGFFRERPDDFSALVETEERFSVFFPLGAALNRGIFRIVANEPVAMRRAAPLYETWNDTMLVERIADDSFPSGDPT